jgi:hypothetical protein
MDEACWIESKRVEREARQVRRSNIEVDCRRRGREEEELSRGFIQPVYNITLELGPGPCNRWRAQKATKGKQAESSV